MQRAVEHRPSPPAEAHGASRATRLPYDREGTTAESW